MKDTLIVGDKHYGIRNDSPDFLEYQMKFVEECLIPYCRDHNIKRIFFVGDMFDKRKQTNTRTLHEVRVRLIEALRALGIDVIILLGNHDIFYRDSLEISTPYEFFANRYKGVYVITEPCTTKIGKMSVDIIPWICKENHDDVMNFISSSQSDVALGHFELTGFKFAKDGQVCENGLSPKVLRKYKRVYSGHFHGESENGNIKYVGTPYQLTWSDYNDPKGFYVFDSDNGEVEFVPNPFEMFKMVVYDEDLPECKKPDITNFHQYKDTVVKLVVKNRKSKAKFNKFRDMFYQVKVMKLDIIEQDQAAYDANKLLTLAEAQDTETLIVDSVKNLQNQEVDQNVLQSLMKSIHDRALERRSTI